MKRRFISIVLVASLVLVNIILSGCKPKKTDDSNNGSDGEPMIVWSFSEETKKTVEDHYLKAFPDKKVTVQVYPLDVFKTRLDGAIRTGKNIPDVVALEISLVRKYVLDGSLMNLTELGFGNRAKEELYGYTVDIGTGSDGNLYALSNQATPGGFFYRRNMAQELWGNDSPEFVQEKLSDWDKFLDVAAQLKGKGDKRIVSNLNAAQKVFGSARSGGWVVDNKLRIDPGWETYLNMIRTMQDKLYSNETTEYAAGGGWFSDISGDKVFGYFSACWGLNRHLKPNANANGRDTTGDWGVVQGPMPYFNGGTWFAGIKASKKPEDVKSFLEYIMFNQDYLTGWATRTGDFASNKLTVAAVRDKFNDEFLQGQNHYELFEGIVDKISAQNITIYDDVIGKIFSEVAVSYALRDSGYDTIENTYAKFKNLVKSSYQDIETE